MKSTTIVTPEEIQGLSQRSIDILNVAASKAGRKGRIIYQRPLKFKKKSELYEVGGFKRSEFYVWLDREYNNQKVIKEGHADGSIEKRGLYPGWVKHSRVHYVNTNNGNHFIAASGNNISNPRLSFFYLTKVDGTPVRVKKESLVNDLLASELKSEANNTHMFLNLEHIVAIDDFS